MFFAVGATKNQPMIDENQINDTNSVFGYQLMFLPWEDSDHYIRYTRTKKRRSQDSTNFWAAQNRKTQLMKITYLFIPGPTWAWASAKDTVVRWPVGLIVDKKAGVLFATGQVKLNRAFRRAATDGCPILLTKRAPLQNKTNYFATSKTSVSSSGSQYKDYLLLGEFYALSYTGMNTYITVVYVYQYAR